MLTPKAQSSLVNGTRYFREDLTRDDYYSDRQHTLGQWFGKGCAALGIDPNAPVQEKDFVALCKGLRPDDQTRLTLRNGANRRCFYDVTISAPKSISIMAILADDERIIAAHNSAVVATLISVESLAQVRVRKGPAVDTKESRATGNIVCASFLHQESRALDPQLHTHCVVFNVTYDPVEQRLKALEARLFYDKSKDLTRFYREQLEIAMRELGYRTYQDRGGCVQIGGVSPKLMAKFSKRAAQRDMLVALREKELGRPLTNNEISKVVHQNRAKKQKRIDPEALRRVQLAQLTSAERQGLEKLKLRALDGRQQVHQPVWIPLRSTPESSWVSVVRLGMMVARNLGIQPYLFSPMFTFPDRVLFAARLIRQAQRTASVFRYAQRNQHRGIGR